MGFIENHTGEFAALLTAVFWAVSALAFETATIRLGSVAVNILRLILGFMFLAILNAVRRGLPFPSDAGIDNWFWLILSGLVGFVFGDLFLFRSYAIIGSRFSMLIMTLVPPVTAFFGWLMLGEHLTLLNLLGMILTFSGIGLAILTRDGSKKEKLTLKLKPVGVLYAFGGTLGQALGLILSKMGMKDYDPFASTQIRIIAGIGGFAVLITFMKRWTSVIVSLRDKAGMKALTVGALFGPFLGVSFSLVAVQLTKAGIASTIMALTPVFILLPAVFLYRQKVTLPEIAGALISVSGVALFFL